MSQDSDVRSEDSASRPPQFTLKGLLVFVTLMSVLCALCVPVFRKQQEAARGGSCHGLRVGMIVMALHNYHQVYGCFPPAYITDKNGKPMHSWRVLILPYMELDELYKRYDFSEPWDGPHNRLLAKDIPAVYRCPSSCNPNQFATSYVAVVGPKTAWPGTRSVRRQDITDAFTLMLVEVADSDVQWMEPRDMSSEEAIKGVNVDKVHGISSYHPGGAYCGEASVPARFLSDDTEPELLKRLLTINGGESISLDNNGKYCLDPKK